MDAVSRVRCRPPPGEPPNPPPSPPFRRKGLRMSEGRLVPPPFFSDSPRIFLVFPFAGREDREWSLSRKRGDPSLRSISSPVGGPRIAPPVFLASGSAVPKTSTSPAPFPGNKATYFPPFSSASGLRARSGPSRRCSSPLSFVVEDRFFLHRRSTRSLLLPPVFFRGTTQLLFRPPLASPSLFWAVAIDADPPPSFLPDVLFLLSFL